jgi:hypothetical protein
MTTSLRRSMGAAIWAAVLGTSHLACAPAASAPEGLPCESPPFTSGGHVSIGCEGHGIATLVGQCGSLTAQNSTRFDHHGGWPGSTAARPGPSVS